MPTQRWIPAACLWLGLMALDAAAGRANFTVEKWDNERGLPSKVVIATAQTPDGYLWLGTYNGLTRFDGIHFTVFDENEAPGLSSNPIVFLFADSHGNLWVGTESAGIRLIKDGQVRPLEIGTDLGKPGHEGRLAGACEAKDGTVWLATANGQLCRYRPGQDRPGQMDVWSRPEFDNARGVIVEPSGSLVLATESGFFIFDSEALVSGQDLPAGKHFAFLQGRMDYLLARRSGGFWLLANGQVRKFHLNQSEPELERNFGPYPWADAQIFAACEDLEGNLIVGTQNRGLTWFDADGHSESLTSANGLSHGTALSLHMDREGSLWVGTDGGGLNRVKRHVFGVQPGSQGLTVQSVCADAVGGLWFGINGGSLKYWNAGVAREFGPEEGLFNLNVRSVFVDRNQTVWVGTFGSGLFQREGDSFRTAPGSESLPREVSAIFQDRAGVLWVGTQGGLARWDGNAWDLKTTTNGLAGDAVRAIAEDAAGNLWIGTRTGLSRKHGEGFDSVHVKDGLPSEDVSALLADAAGALWVGTRGSGLARLAAGKWTQFTPREGLAGNSITYLAEDAVGGLWLGSFKGLMRLEKAELNDFAEGRVSSFRCRAYGKLDGLVEGECSSGSQPAAWRGPDGTMWFPTVSGLVTVNPAQLARNTNLPPVKIEAVFVEDVLQNTNRLRADLPKRILIPAGKERLDIRYTSLNLLAPDRAHFKYQMEPWESGWTDAGDTRVAHYPKLPPGDYRFHVKACNEDGVWNDAGATLALTVEPPFWRTWWFMTLSTAGLLGAIIATVHFVSTQKLQRQLARLRQQEALEKERSRIARDLHDQLGANLTQVSLLGELVESDKDLPDEVEAHARQISETARATSLALDEIVWSANPSNDTLESLVTYACKYAQEYLAVAGLSYRLEAPEKLPAVSIPPEVRHNVFLAFKESVNNVVKHARATAVKVRVRVEPNRFILEVEDNGRGVADADKTKGRNGLRNMARRMEDVHGAFSLGPGAHGGTLVRLTSPCGGIAP